MIKCYYPPINIVHLGDSIYMDEDKVYEYTKELYERGLGHKATPPQIELDVHDLYRLRGRYNTAPRLSRWIIDKLM